MNIETSLNVVPQGYRNLGLLLHKFTVWKRACPELAFIVDRKDPIIAPSGDFGADENGFHLRGNRIAEFADIDTDRPRTSDHSCVGFTFSADNKDAVIVPTVRPEGHDPRDGVTVFAEWHDNEDDALFVSDMGGTMQGSSRGVTLEADVLTVDGLRLPVDEMVWSEFEDGGDGTHHLYVALTKGRFYHIVGGYFS